MTGLRFFTVYGPWGRPDMAMWIFTKALFAGEPLPLYNGGEMRRDFTYIDDIVRGVVACLDGPPADDGAVKAGGSTAPHALYNIGNHRSEDLMRVVELLEQATGKKALLDPQPMQPGDVKETFADISAIERDHGFHPQTTDRRGRAAVRRLVPRISQGLTLSLPPILSNLRLPVIARAFVHRLEPKLVIAQCTSGMVGSFPALNARPAEKLDEWIHEITEALAAWDRDHPDSPAAPYAVNQIVHRSNDRFEHDMAMCAKWKVPIVITSLGARTELNEAVHGWGGITLHDIIDDRFARKAVEKGADGIIAVAAGAGGHAGRWSPFALLQEIRLWFDGPLILSGAIASGGPCSRRWLPAPTSLMSDRRSSRPTKPMRPTATSRRSSTAARPTSSTPICSPAFMAIICARQLLPAGLDPDALAGGNLDAMKFGSEGSNKSKAWRDIWGSGQGIGIIDRVQPAAQLIDTLADQYSAAKARVCAG